MIYKFVFTYLKRIDILFWGKHHYHYCYQETINDQSEKNNERYDDKWPFLFNAIIDSLNLKEIEMSGRKYTWGGNTAWDNTWVV